ncbi:phosphate ABC transporter permease subunit PstC [Ilumatobacter coccineus]|uniref:Phosphate transport system permease protein n=1 Tax=Ilumatobacter coccineus (strain NBRC 103263 / KCTC 29153 / YM16-304) TaxID=1313172 RepID=A0A6C7DXC8_ILUCY|nr:phosphate ABC transporter permease subunit PstC [Ilumatobacter coccineus]BAN01084.1 phosphate ABC transporter permease protein [Ilumatobacter coccineus YM16-304]
MSSPVPITIEQLETPGRRHAREIIIKGAAFLAALVSVLISVLIVFSLFREAWTFMSQIEWAKTWGEIGWFPRRGIYDVPTLLVSSLIVTAVAMIVAMPIGLGAAIYLSEYAKPKVRKILKPTLEILAGIPSVVLGFFALTFLAPNVVARIGGDAGGSLMAAGMGVGILSIPLVASISEDAMRSVPRELREASAGLGARKVTTTTRVVLPAAVSGLVAAFIVAVSRAIGETMVVFLAGGATDAAIFNSSPFDGGLTMTAAMASLASGTDSVVGEGLTFQSLYFVGLMLFLITLVLNIIGNSFVARVREKY